MSKVDVEKISQLMKEGHSETALSEIQSIQTGVDSNSENSIRLEILKAQCFGTGGQFQNGLVILSELIPQIDNSRFFRVYAEAMVQRVEYLFRINQLAEALELIKPLQDELESELDILLGKKVRPWEIKTKKKLGIDIITIEKLIGKLENRRGTISWNAGNMREGRQHLQRALDIAIKFNDSMDMLIAHNNLGILYLMKGDLNEALSNLEASLFHAKSLNIPNYIGAILGNIGQIYHWQGNYDTAYSTYLEGLSLYNHTPKSFFKSGMLFDLVILNIEFEKMELANEYLGKLGGLRELMGSPLVNQQYKIAKAMILKSQGRMNKWAEAHNILEEVIQESIIEPDLTMFALKNMCDIVLKELKTFETPEILQDLLTYTNKMEEIATNEHLYVMLVETHWLQSKCALITLDVDNAKQLLQKALVIAQEKDLGQLVMKLSIEQDFLINQLTEWENLRAKTPKFSEIYEITEIDRSINYILRTRVRDLPEEQEEPIMMLILIGGLAVYSMNFTNVKSIDQQIIAGLVSAINSFTQKAFSLSGSIERIKHKEFNLLMKIWDFNTDVMVCYAFNGPSYYAMKKLYQTISSFNNSSEIQEIFVRDPFVITDEDEKLFENMFTAVFTK